MNHTFEQLLEKYLQEDLTTLELGVLLQMLREPANQETFQQVLLQKFETKAYTGLSDPAKDRDVLFRQMLAKANGLVDEEQVTMASQPARRMDLFRRVAIAASILLLLSVAGYFFLSRDPATSQPVVIGSQEQRFSNDVNPGSDGAILTLANGEQLLLDSAGNGMLASQGNSHIVKGQEQLRYEAVDNKAGEIVYNSIATPRGKQYKDLVLSDGSRIWLDAGSSIRFPVAFSGKERRVEITGQVWFDIAHKKQQPFVVVAKGTEIIDLGTRFNVNAYDDETLLKTTLVQGAVKIQSTILEPGQQAQVDADGKLVAVKTVDTEEVLSL